MDMFSKGKLYFITALTIGALGFTGNFAVNKYSDIEALETIERATTGYFIVTDKSMKRIRRSQESIRDLLSEPIEINDDKDLDEIIEEQKRDARFVNENLAQTNEKIRELYKEARDKIENIATMPLENMEKYSQLWARTIKVKAFIDHEYITFATRKMNSEGYSNGKIHEVYTWWVRSVLNKEEKDKDREYQALRTRVQLYTNSEIEKQGLANIIEDINDFMRDKRLTRGEKQMYQLVKDSIRETKSNTQALEMIDYIRCGKIPENIGGSTYDILESQAKMFEYIDRAKNLVENKVYLISKAEELGEKIETEDLEILGKISEKYTSLKKEIDLSRKEMDSLEIEYTDPAYNSMINSMKKHYWGLFGSIMLLELGLGYAMTRSVRKDEKINRLIRKMEEDIYVKGDTD